MTLFSSGSSIDKTFFYTSETSNSFKGVATGTAPAAHGTANTYNCLAYSVGITDHWEWPWVDQQGYSKTPTFTELKTYMSGKGYKNSSTSMMLWTKVIYYNGDHFAKVIAWDAAGIPSRIMSKWGTAELIESSSTNPFISIYGTGTYYFN